MFHPVRGCRQYSPFSSPAGVHDGVTAPPEREDDCSLLPRVMRLRLGHWGIVREDFVASWAIRSSGLRPLKRFSLAPQPSVTSSCHQTPLPISAVHHPPRLQSHSGAHTSVSLPLCDGRSRRRPAPVRPATPPRHPRPRTAGAFSQACCLDASLRLCKSFIVELRLRSIPELASPLPLFITYI